MNIYIQQIVIDNLLKDNSLRMRLALELNCTEQAVLKMAQKSNSMDIPNSSLTKLAAIEFFRAEGYTDEEIYYKNEPALP